MAVELGTGYVSIVPSAKGIANNIQNELGLPINQAATKAGQDASKAIGAGAKSASGVVASEAQNIGSKFSPIGKAAGQAGKEIQSQFAGVGTSILGAAATPAVLATAVVGAGAVAAKAVTAYENLGLSVGKFSDATGLSTEASSRWVEVANDAGVSTDGLQRSIGFLQKAAGNTPQAFEDLGVAIAHTKDGAVDVQQTFLNATDAIRGIKDPNEKAAAAAKLFGRSWQDMAELINRGSGQLKTDLASVQASKVFSTEDVNQSRALRDAFDSVSDALDGLLLTLGKSLAPALVSIVPAVGKLVAALGPLVQIVGEGLASAIKIAEQSLGVWADQLQGAADKAHASYVHIGTDLSEFRVAIEKSAKGSVNPDIGNLNAQRARSMELAAQAAPILAEEARQQRSVTAAGDEWTAKANAYIAQQETMNAKLQELSDSYRSVMTEGGNTDRQVAAFSATLKASADDASASTTANLELNDAYATLDDAVKKNGKSFDDHTQKGRDNIQALLGVGDAIRDNLIVQLKDSDGNYQQVTKSADLYRQQLVAQMTQAGLSADEQQHYLEVLGLTPEQVSTTIKLSGQAAAQQAVDALNVSLDQFDDPVARQAYVEAITKGDYETALNVIDKMTHAQDKTVNYSVNTTYREFGNRTPFAKSASGGPVSAGNAYLVGDKPGGGIGPWTELFVPKVDGSIISAPQLRTMISLDRQGGGSTGPAQQITVNNYRRDIGVADLNHVLTMARLAA